MSVFAIIGITNAAAIKTALVAQYGANHYEFAPYAWLVNDPGTSKEVADKLGITAGVGDVQGLVVKFDGYSGRGPATAWTWLQNIPGTVPNG
jgi:hypothetical protein